MLKCTCCTHFTTKGRSECSPPGSLTLAVRWMCCVALGLGAPCGLPPLSPVRPFACSSHLCPRSSVRRARWFARPFLLSFVLRWLCLSVRPSVNLSVWRPFVCVSILSCPVRCPASVLSSLLSCPFPCRVLFSFLSRPRSCPVLRT